MASFPLLAIVVAAYTALALVAPGWLNGVVFVLPLLSGSMLPFQGGDLLLVVGLLLLCVEVKKGLNLLKAGISF